MLASARSRRRKARSGPRPSGTGRRRRRPRSRCRWPHSAPRSPPPRARAAAPRALRRRFPRRSRWLPASRRRLAPRDECASLDASRRNNRAARRRQGSPRRPWLPPRFAAPAPRLESSGAREGVEATSPSRRAHAQSARRRATLRGRNSGRGSCARGLVAEATIDHMRAGLDRRTQSRRRPCGHTSSMLRGRPSRHAGQAPGNRDRIRNQAVCD